MNLNVKHLKQPYDLYLERRHRLIIALSIAGFVWFCLFAFGAFEFDYFPLWKRFYLTGTYALASLLVCLLTLFPVRNLLIKRLTLGNTILLSMLLMALIGVINTLLTTLLFKWETLDLLVLVKNVAYTLAIGVIVTPFLMLLHYNYLLRKGQGMQKKVEPFSANTRVTLESDYQDGKLELDLMKLLFIRSADNYIDIYYLNGKQVKHQLIRKTLSYVEKELDVPGLLRCHRSYVVNLHRISGYRRNPFKLKFDLDGTLTEVPVSRKYKAEVARVMEQLQQSDEHP